MSNLELPGSYPRRVWLALLGAAQLAVAWAGEASQIVYGLSAGLLAGSLLALMIGALMGRKTGVVEAWCLIPAQLGLWLWDQVAGSVPWPTPTLVVAELLRSVVAVAGLIGCVAYAATRSSLKATLLAASLALGAGGTLVPWVVLNELQSSGLQLITGQQLSDPDSAYRFQPGSVLRSSYPSNPRGYFLRWTATERAFSDHWLLALSPQTRGVHRRLHESDPFSIRVEVPRGGATAWQAALNFGAFGLERGRHYRASWEMRGDAGTVIECQVAPHSDTWRLLAPPKLIRPAGDWSPVELAWIASSDVPAARLVFLSGVAPGDYEVRQLRLTVDGAGAALRPLVTRYRMPYHVTYELNSQGFRGPEWTLPRPPSEFRVACLGDSFCFGVGVHEPDVFSNQLEQRLARRWGAGCGGERVRVMNLGVPGLDTVHERRMFQALVDKVDPQIVLLLVCHNDDYLTMDHRGTHPPPAPRRFREMADEIVALGHDCQRRRIRFGVVVFRNTRKLLADWTDLLSAISGPLDRAQVPWIDLGEQLVDPYWYRDLTVHARDGHPNEVAHRDGAALVENFLDRLGWVP